MASIMKEQIIKKNTTVNNNNRITTIIITSYVNSHPETDLLEQVVLSLNHIELLNQGNIIIVFDGKIYINIYISLVKDTQTHT